CKAMRFTSSIVADVTTLNFNLMFEIGFTIGLGQPLIPIRDRSYNVDDRDFEELEILSTLGYLDFANHEQLLDGLINRLPGKALAPGGSTDVATEAPLYVLKGPVDTEGTIQLMSAIKK